MINNDFLENVLEAAAGIAELTIDFALDVTQDVFQLADELLHLDEEGYQSPFAERGELTTEDDPELALLTEEIDNEDVMTEDEDCDNEEEHV